MSVAKIIDQTFLKKRRKRGGTEKNCKRSKNN